MAPPGRGYAIMRYERRSAEVGVSGGSEGRMNRRASFGYRFARAVITPAFARIYAFHAPETGPLPEPFLLVPNHSTEMDFLMVMHTFRQEMDFVIGEALLRNPVLRFLFTTLHRPVIIHKGGAEAQAGMEILKRLRMGRNVCLFAEGNTCFDGVTGPIPKGTGQLARASGASLVTFRISGGYLSAPRWGYGLRRGRCWGDLVRVYSPEELKGMSYEAVLDAIREDLFVDELARQRVSPIPYRSRRGAEGLHHALYLCPSCGEMDTLDTRGDRAVCAHCGMTARYTSLGFLEGSMFDTVGDWLRWQKESLRDRLSRDPGFFLSDPDQALRRIGEDHRVSVQAEGRLSMDSSGLTVGGARFPWEEVAGIAIFRKDRLVFTASGEHFEIVSRAKRSALKYRDFYQIIRDKE